MELNDREIGFRRSVYAEKEIAKISPNHDPSKLGKLLAGGDVVVALETMVTFIRALSEAYENHRKRKEPGYIPNPVTEDELMDESTDTVIELFNKAVEVFQEDGKTTVESEPPKGKNAEAASE